MKTSILGVGILSLVGICPGTATGEAERDAVIKDSLALMTRATQVLAGITNEKTLKAATPTLKKIGQERRALAARYRKLKLSKEEEAQLKRKYAEQADSRRRKLDKEKNRIKKMRGGQQALDLLEGKPEKKNSE